MQPSPAPPPPYFPPPQQPLTPPPSRTARNIVIVVFAVVAAILLLFFGMAVLNRVTAPGGPTSSPASITVTQTGVATGCVFSFGNGPYTFTFTLVNTGDTGGTATVDFYLDGNYVTENSFYVPGHSSAPESQSATSACGATSYSISLIGVR